MASTIKVIPKKSFLLRVEDKTDGSKDRIIARKGEQIEVYPMESKRFASNFVFINPSEEPKKKKSMTVK